MFLHIWYEEDQAFELINKLLEERSDESDCKIEVFHNYDSYFSDESHIGTIDSVAPD